MKDFTYRVTKPLFNSIPRITKHEVSKRTACRVTYKDTSYSVKETTENLESEYCIHFTSKTKAKEYAESLCYNRIEFYEKQIELIKNSLKELEKI